jgi:TonB family protein
MNHWRLLLVACLACTSADALAAGAKAYSCEGPGISSLRVTPRYSVLFDEFRETRDPAERRKLVQPLRDRARTETERDWATFADAMVLTDDKKYVEAGQLYEEIAASRVVSRGMSDSARIALAKLAMQREDDDGALAWLEPMVAAECRTVEDEARRLLAYLYQEKGRLEEALEQVDNVTFRGAADADHWHAVRIDFRCSLEGDMRCMRQIGCLARGGDLGTKALAAANRHITRMRASESGQAALTSGREFGVLNEQGQVVVSKVEQVVPVKRVSPVYPRDAVHRGISGYVDVAVVINADGIVNSAEVWDARPMRVFDAAALRAARASTFKPKIVDGHPVEGRGLQRYQFSMQN